MWQLQPNKLPSSKLQINETSSFGVSIFTWDILLLWNLGGEGGGWNLGAQKSDSYYPSKNPLRNKVLVESFLWTTLKVLYLPVKEQRWLNQQAFVIQANKWAVQDVTHKENRCNV